MGHSLVEPLDPAIAAAKLTHNHVLLAEILDNLTVLKVISASFTKSEIMETHGPVNCRLQFGDVEGSGSRLRSRTVFARVSAPLRIPMPLRRYDCGGGARCGLITRYFWWEWMHFGAVEWFLGLWALGI